MDTSSQRVAAPSSRMQDRHGLPSRAGGRLVLVPSDRLELDDRRVRLRRSQRSPAARAPRTRHCSAPCPRRATWGLHLDVRRLRPIGRPRCRARRAPQFRAVDARLSMQRRRVAKIVVSRRSRWRRLGRELNAASATGAAASVSPTAPCPWSCCGDGHPVLIQVRPQTNLSPGFPPTSLKRRRGPSRFQRAVKPPPPVPWNSMTSLKTV